MSPTIAVIYHSRRGTVRALAALAAEGARETGAEVRLLRVADDAASAGDWPERIAEPEDVLHADGLVLAAPTYYGMVSSPFKRFLESTSPLWGQGLLADRVATCVTASTQRHGGREATLTSLHHTLTHWGCWVAGADPGDPVTLAAGGTPYGLVADNSKGMPGAAEQTAARALGRRLAELTARAHPEGRRLRGPAPEQRTVLATPGGLRGAGAVSGDLPPAAPPSTAPPPGTSAAPPGPGMPLRPVRLTVVYHGEDAATRILAQEAAAAARALGAGVRLRCVAREGASRDADWLGPRATPAGAEDIAWADAVLFGAPARLGALAAPLLEFIQSLAPTDTAPGPLWGKPAGGFTVVPTPHAGAETALLDLGHMLLHTGAVLVPPGYTDPSVEAAGGNPYGTSWSLTEGPLPTPEATAAAAHQGRRTVLAGDLLRRSPAMAPAPDLVTPPTPPGPVGPAASVGSTV
ncbi:flavodoxin family protein [Streptomyces roseirectus]|uniref:Flavodoxin family protein n=1 Tax=Streptomyces roseirectus TaxID=2768066 RepID=A0A7H0I799_9ACTN|nr:flavodoxin family protein [Streptomyces roseirectus]QNP68665.1 flavodoxin family protein [Streptomyces roseirectus]